MDNPKALILCNTTANTYRNEDTNEIHDLESEELPDNYFIIKIINYAWSTEYRSSLGKKIEERGKYKFLDTNRIDHLYFINNLAVTQMLNNDQYKIYYVETFTSNGYTNVYFEDHAFKSISYEEIRYPCIIDCNSSDGISTYSHYTKKYTFKPLIMKPGSGIFIMDHRKHMTKAAIKTKYGNNNNNNNN